jgi:hypothetical protein
LRSEAVALGDPPPVRLFALPEQLLALVRVASLGSLPRDNPVQPRDAVGAFGHEHLGKLQPVAGKLQRIHEST